ncbi:Gfo/Idh/MocA family protein [Radiobacillus sp. PE A8.2]|uniref:Gfo/Idh/MocA family protein n=1 Tax=Radiobacillus sp. PE A8.2 TaxID=3380349 RepID=UPI0038909C7A
MNFRTAILGAGKIAKSHLKFIQEMDRMQAVAIADINAQRAEDLAAQYKLKAYTDYKQMIHEEKPDIVIITLPHFLHKEAAVFSANRHCHILLEKPMAMNMSECEEIITSAEKNGVQLMVGHTQHYIAQNMKAKELIEQRNLGDLVMINDTRHVHYFTENRPQWFLEKDKAGGGIMMNLGSHSIDNIQWITGQRIAKVKAKLSYYGDRGDVEGSGLLYLETTNGVPISIAQSGYAGVPKHETEFIFTNGMIKLQTSRGLWISKGNEFHEVEVEVSAPPFHLQFKELIEAIDGVKPLSSSGQYAKSIIEVVEGIYESYETDHEVILSRR